MLVLVIAGLCWLLGGGFDVLCLFGMMCYVGWFRLRGWLVMLGLITSWLLCLVWEFALSGLCFV